MLLDYEIPGLNIILCITNTIRCNKSKKTKKKKLIRLSVIRLLRMKKYFLLPIIESDLYFWILLIYCHRAAACHSVGSVTIQNIDWTYMLGSSPFIGEKYGQIYCIVLPRKNRSEKVLPDTALVCSAVGKRRSSVDRLPA